MKKLFIILMMLCLPSTTLAATYFFTPTAESLDLHEQFTITLQLDAEDEFVNAVEGVLKFPKRLLKVVSIDLSESIVSAWVAPPQVKGEEVRFSGIIPGGFDGVRTPLELEKSP